MKGERASEAAVAPLHAGDICVLLSFDVSNKCRVCGGDAIAHRMSHYCARVVGCGLGATGVVPVVRIVSRLGQFTGLRHRLGGSSVGSCIANWCRMLHNATVD